MGSKSVGEIPATLPVEFTERIIYLMVNVLGMWPQLGAVVAFDGRLDEARLGNALRLLTVAEPVLGCRLVAGGTPPVWRRLEGLDRNALLRVQSASDLAAAAEAFVAEPFDVEAGPQVVAALLRGPESDTFALKMSHVAVDGGALKEALYLLGDIYRTLGDDPGWTPEPNLDGLRGPRAKAGPIETLKALANSKMEMPPSDWRMTLHEERGDAGYTSAVVEPETFRAATAFGKQLGATVNDVLIAAYYRALWRLLGAGDGDQTPCQVSCELRKHLPPGTKTALANISNSWNVCVSPQSGEDFEDTLIRVVSWTSAWKRAGSAKEQAIAVPIANKMMSRQGLDKMRAMFEKAVSASLEVAWRPTLTNIGVIDEALLDFGDGIGAADAWLLGPISMAGAALTASTYRDRLHLCVGAEFATMDRELVSSMVCETAREIEDWVATRQTGSDEQQAKGA